jgi:hypothetical protein
MRRPRYLSGAGLTVLGMPAIAVAKEARPTRSNTTKAVSHAEPLKVEGLPDAVPTL